MPFGITSKLFIAVLLTNVITAVAVGLGVRAAFNSGFESYIVAREEQRLSRLALILGDEFRAHRSWDFLKGNEALWLEMNFRVRPERRDFGAMPGLPRDAGDLNLASRRDAGDPNPAFRRDAGDSNPASRRPHLLRPPRALVLDGGQNVVVGDADPMGELDRHPIIVNGTTVGWLASPIRETVFDVVDRRFQQQQWQASLIVALIAMGLAAIVAWFLARGLIAPVKRLGAATRKLADGDYRTRVASHSTDELGRLVDDFNRLGNALEKHEASRRNLMADVSHELRTPLAVLKGELEALQDGVRPMSRDTIASLQAEVSRLGTLVHDIHDLSLADVGGLAYHLGRMDLAETVREGIRASQVRLDAHGITTELRIPEGAFAVRGDGERLAQLIGNLAENTLRYTDPGGRLRVTLRREDRHAVIEWEDSNPGVGAEALPRLFERFFRVEVSRSRERGGSGLGLSICRSIAEAHGGSIEARASELGGLRIIVRIPLSAGADS